MILACACWGLCAESRKREHSHQTAHGLCQQVHLLGLQAAKPPPAVLYFTNCLLPSLCPYSCHAERGRSSTIKRQSSWRAKQNFCLLVLVSSCDERQGQMAVTCREGSSLCTSNSCDQSGQGTFAGFLSRSELEAPQNPHSCPALFSSQTIFCCAEDEIQRGKSWKQRTEAIH